MLTPGSQTNKIVLKVVLCLFLPLVVQCLFFWDFYLLEKQSVKMADQEARLNDFTSSTQEATILLINSAASYLSYASGGDLVQRSVGLKRMQEADEKIKDLEQLAKDNPLMEKQVQDFRRDSEPALKAIRSLGYVENHSDQQFGGVLMTMAKMRPLVKEMGGMNGRALETFRRNKARVDEEREEQTQVHNARMGRILLGLITVALVGFMAAGWLGFDLAKRLSVLVGNAFRLPRGLPLTQTVKGNDELSYLDEVLHEAEGYLKESAEQRSLIMEMVAHDMRSPLMSGQIALELLTQMSPPTTESANRQAVSLKRNLDVVVNLVNDLLTIDRLEAGALDLQKTPQAVASLVEAAITSVDSIALTKGVALDTIVDPEIYILADGDRIIQVLTNLLGNAIKFSPKNSTVLITAAAQERFVQICVADQGPGLPPGLEETIFNKFQQVQREDAKKGFGLGLTICKMLVELHGGKIIARRRPEGGSKFCFWISPCKPGTKGKPLEE